MAKRIYTPKPVSPEIARENAISEARSRLHNERKHLKLSESVLASYLKRGDEFGDPTPEGTAHRQRAVDISQADVARLEAELEALS
jgi:hypothetical protein